jgi:hypothetical protein
MYEAGTSFTNSAGMIRERFVCTWGLVGGNSSGASEEEHSPEMHCFSASYTSDVRGVTWGQVLFLRFDQATNPLQ